MVTVVVDAANVMGSRPDGWWRDRAGAAVRLHEDLLRLAERGVRVPDDGSGDSRHSGDERGDEPGGDEAEFVLVLEGAARAAMSRINPGKVRVVVAPGSGDDAIVDLVREVPGRCMVVTADRELRRRVGALGAAVLGPGWLLALFRQ
ncbi:MAG TPA: hypothetical protein VF060_07560 [Trebonia sp.]